MHVSVERRVGSVRAIVGVQGVVVFGELYVSARFGVPSQARSDRGIGPIGSKCGPTETAAKRTAPSFLSIVPDAGCG